jgi:peptidyl-prolyl cis-trans isomerase C
MKLLVSSLPASMRARVALAVGVVLVVLGLATGITFWATALPSRAAFTVHGAIMTKDELAHRVRMLGALYGIQAPPQGTPWQLDQFRRDSARVIAVSMVIDQAAQDRHIDVSDPEARTSLNDLVNGLHPPGEESFIRLLGETGASQNDVLDELRRQIRDGRLFHQIVDESVQRLTEADYQHYYQKNAAALAIPEKRHLRNIVVRTQDEASQVADRARAGTDFGALALESSLDDATRENQGDLGFVTRNQLEPKYRDAAFSTPVGAVFGPVQTNSGWNVGRVDEDQPTMPQTYEQVKQQVVQTVRANRAAQSWNAWLADQVAGADIRYADEYQPRDPDSAPTTGFVPGAPGPAARPGPSYPEPSR